MSLPQPVSSSNPDPAPTHSSLFPSIPIHTSKLVPRGPCLSVGAKPSLALLVRPLPHAGAGCPETLTASCLKGTDKAKANIWKSTSLTDLPHQELALTSIAVGFRLPKVLNINLSIQMVNKNYPEIEKKMARDETLLNFRNAYFVFWDTLTERGWMVNGQAAALYLLRAHLQSMVRHKKHSITHLEKLTFAKNENLGLVYDQLMELAKQEVKPLTGTKHEPPATTDDEKKKAEGLDIGEMLDDILAILTTMRRSQQSLYKAQALSSTVVEFYDNHWALAVKGWQIWQLTDDLVVDLKGKDFKKYFKDHSWVKLAKDLEAPFLFGHNLDELIEPKGDDPQRGGHPPRGGPSPRGGDPPEGGHCPHFSSLPKGEFCLAVAMDDIQRMVVENTAVPGMPTDTPAKLSKNFGWARDPKRPPFGHKDQKDHLNAVDDKCFPVQTLFDYSTVKHQVETAGANAKDKVKKLIAPEDKGKDKKTEKGKEQIPKLYSYKEVCFDFNFTEGPDRYREPREWEQIKEGAVVFGPKPSEKLLKSLAEPRPERKPKFQATQKQIDLVYPPGD